METNVDRQRCVAVAMVRDNGGRLLVQRRNDPNCPAGHGRWELPGGCVDFGEKPGDTAVRETLEEASVFCAVERMLPVVCSMVWNRTDGTKVHAIVICFECRYLGGDARPSDPWVSEVSWKTEEEIAALDCLDGIPAFLAASGAQRLTSR